jgi:hypothetical protein
MDPLNEDDDAGLTKPKTKRTPKPKPDEEPAKKKLSVNEEKRIIAKAIKDHLNNPPKPVVEDSSSEEESPPPVVKSLVVNAKGTNGSSLTPPLKKGMGSKGNDKLPLAKPKPEPKVVYQSASEESEEEEVIIVKKRKKPKKKKRTIIYEADSTTEEEEVEEEPKPKPRATRETKTQQHKSSFKVTPKPVTPPASLYYFAD